MLKDTHLDLVVRAHPEPDISSRLARRINSADYSVREVPTMHWHLLMAAYSLVRLDPESSALGAVRSKASLLRANLEQSLKETVYNLFLWVRDNDNRGGDDLMEKIDHLFVHSTADANVQS